MRFEKTSLVGAYIVELEKIEDERGYFARAWCQHEFAAQGLSFVALQANLSGTYRKGTLRGLHYQATPYEEAKLVRCARGAIFDVIVDLRPASPSRMKWIGVELTAENGRMLYVPEGFAHGYQTLEDDTEVSYPVSAFFTPGAECGIRFDDPAFAISWPLEVTVISDKDANWADFVDGAS